MTVKNRKQSVLGALSANMSGDGTITPAGVLTVTGGSYNDDDPCYLGTSNPCGFVWDTTDANANMLKLDLPTGGVTDVPALVLGVGVKGVDLTWFNGETQPLLAIAKSDRASYFLMNYNTLKTLANTMYLNSAGSILFQPANSGTYNIKFDIAGNIPSIYGVGAYLRVGDAGTTSHSLATEDDLMVSGKLEVDGAAYFDSITFCLANGVNVDSAGAINIRTSGNTEDYLSITTVSGVPTITVMSEIGLRIDSRGFQIGRDDTGVSTNGITDVLRIQAGAGTNNEAAGQGVGVNFYLGNDASELEKRGAITLFLASATNGSESTTMQLRTMLNGSIQTALSIEPNDLILRNTYSLMVDNTDDSYLLFKGRDNTVGAVELGRLQNAADPYFRIGRDDAGVATNAVTDVLRIQAGAGTNNETIGQGVGVGFYIGNDASEVEKRGKIACSLTTATNGSEETKLLFGNMVGGTLLDNMALTSTELLLGTATTTNFAKLTLRNLKTATADDLIYDSIKIELRGAYWDGAAAQLRVNTIQTIMEDNDPIIFYLKFAGNNGTFMRLRDNAGTMTIHLDQGVEVANSKNVVLGTTNGTQIGTATNQKLGFWGATPVVQQVMATGASHTVDDLITMLQTLGLCKQS